MSQREVSIFSDGGQMATSSLADFFANNPFSSEDRQALFRAFSDRSEFAVNAVTFGGGAAPLIAVKLYEPGDEDKTIDDVLAFKRECYGGPPATDRSTALAALQAAVERANDAGLFDDLAADVHPDTINAFCDGVAYAHRADISAKVQAGTLALYAEARENAAPPVFGRGSVSLSCLNNGRQLTAAQARAVADFIDGAVEAGHGLPDALSPDVLHHVLRVLRNEPEIETLVETIEDTCARRDQNGRPVG